MRNLNIKSDEAYDLAMELSEKTGKSLKLVITDALRAGKRELMRDELTRKWDKIIQEARAKQTPEQRDFDGDAMLYDELGLPK
jgi:hypothetical protein